MFRYAGLISNAVNSWEENSLVSRKRPLIFTRMGILGIASRMGFTTKRVAYVSIISWKYALPYGCTKDRIGSSKVNT